MGLEAATYISELVASNPVGGVDPKAQGDDHLRLVKAVLQASFPNVSGAVTASHTQLNAAANLAAIITGVANPSATIGLVASNGAATTVMRSDAAPALNQAIAPTWTGLHTFNAGAVINALTLSGTAGAIVTINSTAAAGPYAAFSRSGATFGYVGDGSQMGGGFTADSLGLSAVGPLELSAGGNATPNFRIATDGTIITSSDVTIGQDFILNRSFYFNGSGVGGFNYFQNNHVSDLGYRWHTGPTYGTVMSLAADGTLTTPVVSSLTTGGMQDNGKALIDVPRNDAGIARGQCFLTASNVTINTSDLNSDYTYSIFNNSAVPISIIQGTGVTLRLGGTVNTGSRILAPFGLATIWAMNTTTAVVTGHVS